MQPYLPNLLSFIFVSDFWPFSQVFLWMTSILINPKCTALHLGLSGIYWKTRAENPKKKRKGKQKEAQNIAKLWRVQYADPMRSSPLQGAKETQIGWPAVVREAYLSSTRSWPLVYFTDMLINIHENK